MAFKISLVSDVKGFLKGTTDVENALEDVADSLDDLARDTKDDATKAGDDLERSFKDAYDTVKAESKDASKKMGDDIKDGARKASDGIDNFKDEGKQSIRETAASFGDVTDALDLVQEVAANAFSGFGPAGAAAGALAAVGIGLVKSALDQAKEKADATKDNVIDLAKALDDVKGNPAAIDWATELRDRLLEISDNKEWYEFWQETPKTLFEELNAGVKEFGLNWYDVRKAMEGDGEAMARVQAQLNAEQEENNRLIAESMDYNGEVDQSLVERQRRMDATNATLVEQNKITTEGIQLGKDYAASNDGVAEAQKRAADVSEQWADSLGDHLNVAADGLDEFVEDGVLNLDKWAKEVDERVKDVEAIEDFKVDIFPELSPEAQEAFAKLPVESQALIAESYKKGDKGDKQEIKTTLEAQVDTKVTVNDTDIDPVEIPTKVDAPSAVAGANTARNAAQAEANKDGNQIEFKTKIDANELQRQVNRAAASITPPTIWVKTKVKNEVP